MSKKAHETALPKLRFPEFRDAEAWEEKELGKLGKFTGGGTPSKENKDFWQGNIPWISSSDISEDSIYQVKITRFITKDALNESATKLIPENSILLVSRVGVGKLAITNKAVCTSQDFTNFTPTKDDLVFLAYYIKTRSQALLSYSQGMAIKGFTKEDVSTLKLFLPPLAEQQKIAAALSSLDALLTAQTAKLTALQAHKRGLMQDLFPAAGETVPKRRFPEFQDAGEWEETSIGNVCKAFSGGTPSTSQKKYYGGDIPFIRSAEIDKEKTELFLTEEGLANSSAKLVDKGDILFALYGANSGDVAISKQEGAINQAILCLRSKASNVFIFHFLTYQKEWIIKKYLQGGQGNLSGEIVKSIAISFPSPAEQQKIADCLSSLGDLITAQSQKIDALKLHKKGLMQALFPTASESNA